MFLRTLDSAAGETHDAGYAFVFEVVSHHEGVLDA